MDIVFPRDDCKLYEIYSLWLSKPGKFIVWNGWIVNQCRFYQRTDICLYEEAEFYGICINYIFIQKPTLSLQKILTWTLLVDGSDNCINSGIQKWSGWLGKQPVSRED